MPFARVEAKISYRTVPLWRIKRSSLTVRDTRWSLPWCHGYRARSLGHRLSINALDRATEDHSRLPRNARSRSFDTRPRERKSAYNRFGLYRGKGMDQGVGKKLVEIRPHGTAVSMSRAIRQRLSPERSHPDLPHTIGTNGWPDCEVFGKTVFPKSLEHKLLVDEGMDDPFWLSLKIPGRAGPRGVDWRWSRLG